MPILPDKVHPGEVISAELITAILAELARLGGGVQPGDTTSVPDFFGVTLGQARATILAPTSRLQMGFTLDAAGAAINPLAAGNSGLVVLNQSPPANSRVAPNTPVNLLVSAVSVAAPAPPPVITGVETVLGTASSSFAVGATLVLVGSNFSATPSQNQVTFDGIPASLSNDPADPTRRLFVTVPTGIPGGPVNSGDADKSGVVISLRIGSATPVTTTITVTAPVATQPTIASVSPASQSEGENITITGTNLLSTAEVRIRGTLATVVSRNPPTSLVVTVPQFADILPGPPVDATLVVTVDGQSTTFAGPFRVRGA